VEHSDYGTSPFFVVSDLGAAAALITKGFFPVSEHTVNGKAQFKFAKTTEVFDAFLAHQRGELTVASKRYLQAYKTLVHAAHEERIAAASYEAR